MKYLDLRIKPTGETKDNKIQMDKESASHLVRDFSVNQIIPILMYDYDPAKKQSVERRLGMNEMIQLEKLKTRLLGADQDVLEFGDDQFKLLKETIESYEGLPSSMMDFIVSLKNRLEECASQKEEDGKKLLEEAKDKSATFREFYESLGMEVKIQGDAPAEQPEEELEKPAKEKKA